LMDGLILKEAVLSSFLPPHTSSWCSATLYFTFYSDYLNLRVSGLLVEIWTWDLINMKQECCLPDCDIQSDWNALLISKSLTSC
jgi:hypothetical protein